MFLDPLVLPQLYPNPDKPNGQLLKSHKRADAETGRGGACESIFMALIRQNRTNHSLFLFLNDEAQNSIVKASRKQLV